MIGEDYKKVSKSGGQPVAKILRCWVESILCSLDTSGDVIGSSSELSEGVTQQQEQWFCIHELLW